MKGEYMLIRIKDYDYLVDHMQEGPTINSEMLAMAGMTMEINYDNYNEYEHYDIDSPNTGNNWEWLGKWFEVIEPVSDSRAVSYEIPERNLTVEAFEKMSMPPNLQYITIQSKSVLEDKYYDIGSVGSNYELKFQFAPEENIRIKFTDSTEYNLNGYFRGTAQALIDYQPVQFLRDVRIHEPAVHMVVKQIIGQYISQKVIQQPYFAYFKDAFVFKPRYGAAMFVSNIADNFRHRRVIDSATYDSGSDLQHIGLGTIVAYFAANTQAVFKQIEGDDYFYETHNYMSVAKLKDKVPKNYLYLMDGGAAYAFNKDKFYTTIVGNNESFVCPHTGVETYSNHKGFKITPLVFHSVSYYQDSFGMAVRPHLESVSEEDFKTFIDDIVDYLPDKYRYAKLYKKMGSQYVSQQQYDRLIERNKQYEQYGLMFLDSNRVNYRGLNYYVDGDDGINEYDYEADIDFFGDNNDLHLGVELEVDNGGENGYNAGVIAGILGFGHAYYMHDGSLSDGFEIATHPMTLDYHMSIEQRYRDAFGVLTAMGYKSHNTSTCGMHIHFDRSFLGRDSRTRALKASYLAIIMERNWEKFVKFSRRRYDRVEQWANKLDLIKDIYADDTDDDARDKFSDKYGNGDKYVALNTSHSHTYELRIFRGTLKPETYLATLQFVDNLVRVSKECPSLAKAQQITFADIINYNPHQHLVDYITSRGILTREYIEYEGE
jgi:hypothetical protein